MVEIYTRIDWVNKKDGQTTPLGATNLNKMDAAISEMDKLIVELDAVKADKLTVNTMLADCEYDEETGIVKLTRKNGEQIIFDLNIEKIPVAFALSESGVLTMTTEDGTEWTADIGAMIPVLTFNNSDTVNVIVTGSGKNKTYSFEVKDGSITEDKLRPDYLAEIKVESSKAATSATNAATSEHNAAESAKTAQECKEQAGKTVESLVPAWARQESKPEYTAEEVGADPAGTARTLTGLTSYGGMIDSQYVYYDPESGGFNAVDNAGNIKNVLNDLSMKIAQAIAAVHELAQSASGNTGSSSPFMAYAVCEDSSGTVAKTATVQNDSGWELKIGAVVAVKYRNLNTARNKEVTLNINGSGDKTICYGCYTLGNRWRKGEENALATNMDETIIYMYDGTSWLFISHNRDDDSTYSEMTGASTSVNGERGLVPAPRKGDQNKFLRGDDTWAEIDMSSVPVRTRYTVGNATAADSVLITDNGIITLRVYKISNDQLMAVNQYVYVSDTYGDSNTFVGKLAANTGALSNTYGTIAVSTADEAVKVASVKGYRIEITVMDCI